MKSQSSQLLARGFLSEEDLARFRSQPAKNLMRLLESDDAVERTAAVRILALTPGADESLQRLFVERLSRETKLYTKIELCAALQTGGATSARLLLPLLGKIGNNQHKRPSREAFKKSSYPLPRDIVARILGRMDPHVLPTLLACIRDGAREEVVEVIDAVGFMCSYASVAPAQKITALHTLIDCFRSNVNDELTRWKIARALESFNHPESLALLTEITNDSPVLEIRQEAQRSLVLAARQPLLSTATPT
ncbi:HEAT repeat domain-containing protein [Arthrobacter cryoconiti]|uniref:HEAT repeat domain-containing protein n=1 Tax=Arthrobacter cryoconiti TaxID=748907 RepID=A0ABV8R3E1_9MICC|nr:HEAT repeat domain-containing protein [Arthrobacter cryoconiti]MCC9066860.1 hypothetical protein [Arthrobacter cryoconiti]